MKLRTFDIRILWAVLSVSLLASCSKENGTDGVPERDGVVFTVAPKISAGYENIPTTYASGEWSSDKGGMANVNSTDYKLRCILEVWSEDGSAKQYREVKVTGIGDAAPVFSPRLLLGKYKMALWADFVTAQSVTQGNPAGANLFYDASNLNGIALLKADCNCDAKDAYTAVFDADLTSNGLSTTVTLKRPLAKIRLVATDADKANNNTGLDNCKANLSFSNYTDQIYNALNGCVTSSGTLISNESYFSVGSDYGKAYATPSVGGDNHSQTLAWDYVFVPASGLTTDITVKLQTSTGGNIVLPSAADESAITKTIMNVTLKPNSLTTAVGCFFTPAATVGGSGN